MSAPVEPGEQIGRLEEEEERRDEMDWSSEEEEENDPDNTREKHWAQHFGDKRDKKPTEDDTARFATLNVNTFPRLGDPKAIRIREELQGIDCAGLGEININWLKIPTQDTFTRRISHWWKHQRTNHTWLKDYEWPTKRQRGGVSLSLTTNKISKYAKDKGEDASGLGRWVWQTIEGHSETKTAIIQIYRPVKNEKNLGSVYMQQRVAADEIDPHKIFESDLLEMVDTFIEDDFRIIIMGDFNMTLHGQSTLEAKLAERGIEDKLRKRYSEQMPNTHKRGSTPIDGIFASEAIEMIRGGWDRGNDEVGDHRMVWAELSMDSILGVDRGDLTRPNAKKLQATNRKRVDKFNTLMLKQMEQHNLLDRARQLENEVKESKKMTESQARRYEAIDEQRCRAAAYAEERCAAKPGDQNLFSPELKEAMGIFIIWRQVERKKQCKQKIHKRWIIDMKKKLGVTTRIEIPSTLEEIREKARKASEKYKEKKKEAPELRNEFLDLLIQTAEDGGDTKKVRALRNIKEREQTRDVHRRIKGAQGKTRGGGGVRFVQRINEEGETITIKDKKEMEKEIMKANATKLESANESPIRQGELKERITDADYEKWEDFLAGKVDTNIEMETGTKEFLKAFKGTQIKEEDAIFTTDEYIKSWRPVREHTSCAPGALHYGTFKAMHACRPVAELHTIMARIPIRTGYVPRRWTQSVDSMLPKKPNEWRPSKLRLTSLLQADFNHNNKILGRKTMKWAEEKKQLAPEQYGSRKNLSAAKHALNKRLMLDIMRVQRRPGVICANDAKACYDRILHFAAYIALRRSGLSKEATISMLEPIRRLKHVIRTAYGDSEFFYGGEEWERDPSGICQGNGAGPAIWALVSSPLLDILRKYGYGAKLHAAIGKTFLHLSGFAFVDDADTVQTADLDTPSGMVIAEAQRELDLWEQCIRATGGGIEGDKSDFVVVNYNWEGGKWKYEKMNPHNQLSVYDGSRGRENLTQLRTDEARRTLGVWQAADGNEEEQTSRMTKKAKKWSRAAMRSSLCRADVIIGIKTSLYPSVTFGMMATTLDEQQCKNVFKPIREHTLPKAGYSRSLPSTILHGPEEYGGVGLMDIYTIQGIEHVKALIDEGGKDSPTGDLLTILATGHTLEIGRSGRIFEQDYDEIETLMTDSWMKNTLKFTHKTEIKLVTDLPMLRQWREGDELLMDVVARAGTRGEEIEAFNRCRMHLQVTTIADIANGGGTHVHKHAWECRRQWASMSSEAYQWPHQPRPSKQDRETWKAILQQVFGVEPRYRSLPRRLGNYHRQARSHMQWLYSRPDESLYRRRQDGWYRWKRIRRRTRTALYEPTGEMTRVIQGQWEAAVVLEYPNYPRVEYCGHKKFRTEGQDTQDQNNDTERRDPSPTLAGAIRRLPMALQWVMERCTLPKDDGKEIAERVEAGRGQCMSDASVQDQLGTAAALFIGVHEDNNYDVRNRTPGKDEDQSSYRSEACGILANIMMVNIICKRHNVQRGEVELGCDNEGVLWKIFGPSEPNTGDTAFDILKVIRAQIDDSPIMWKYKHVKGHQDDDMREGKTLDTWAKANILADKRADEHWRRRHGTGSRERPEPPVMQGEGWRLTVEGKTVTANVEDTVHKRAYRKMTAAYWEHKRRINPGTFDKVRWDKYKGALKTLPNNKRQWVHKHHCGFEGNNYMMHKWRKRTTPQCPNCAEVETHRHIMQCQSRRATEEYARQERKFEQWLCQTTSPELKALIIAHVQAYRDDREVEEDETWDEETYDIWKAQNELGKNAFTEGCLVHEWEARQREHLTETESKRSPQRWVKELIKKLWNISWDMWESRNDEVHKETATRKSILLAQLDREIREVKALGSTNEFLPRADRIFFNQNTNSILKKTEYEKKLWLHVAKRYIERDRQRVARNRATRIMREWLRPGSTEEIEKRRRTIIRQWNENPWTPVGTRRGPTGQRTSRQQVPAEHTRSTGDEEEGNQDSTDNVPGNPR